MRLRGAVGAVFLETWRTQLWRTWLLPALALALAAAEIGLWPLLSGGAEERLRLHLAYGGAIAEFVCGVFALWAGCASVSLEAERGTLPQLLVKPLPRWKLWLGKWLAVVAGAWTLLLVAALAAAAVFLPRAGKLASSDAPPAFLAAACESRLPAPPDLAPAIDARLAEWRAAAPDRADAQPPPALLAAWQNRERLEASRVAVGRPLAAVFDAGGALDGVPARLRWRCHASIPGTIPFQGAAILSTEPPAVVDLDAPSAVPHEIAVPAPLPSSLQAVFSLADTPDNRGIDFFFDPDDGLSLLVPRGTFAGNAGKALLALASRLALLAAVGVTLGVFFSMPVASFLALALVVLLQCGDLLEEAASVPRAVFVRSLISSFESTHSHDPDAAVAHSPPSAWKNAAANAVFAIYRGTAWTLRPFLRDHAVRDLAAAEWLPPRKIARQAFWQLAAVPALLALLGAAALRKREWGMR